MRTAWIDPDHDNYDDLVGALEGVGFVVIDDEEDAEVLIWTNSTEVGDWSTDMPDEPIAAAWYLVGWLDSEERDIYDDEDDES